MLAKVKTYPIPNTNLIVKEYYLSGRIDRWVSFNSPLGEFSRMLGAVLWGTNPYLSLPDDSNIVYVLSQDERNCVSEWAKENIPNIPL